MRPLAALSAVALVLGSSPASAVGPFILFFESDSTRLVGPSEIMLGNAAAAFRANDVREVRLLGHADRAGSASYNRELSRRRAEAVRAALMSRGYSGTFVIEAHGEERPLVETGDGVAEVQNRRVEVIMECFHRPGPGFEFMRCRK